MGKMVKVLILIVMEERIGFCRNESFALEVYVLILIVMEERIGFITAAFGLTFGQIVLILIVMEERIGFCTIFQS